MALGVDGYLADAQGFLPRFRLSNKNAQDEPVSINTKNFNDVVPGLAKVIER